MESTKIIAKHSPTESDDLTVCNKPYLIAQIFQNLYYNVLRLVKTRINALQIFQNSHWPGR